MIDLKDLYWVTGLIEGEGCFTVDNSRGYPKFRFTMNMVDQDVLKHARQILGVGNITGPYKSKTKRKPFWQYQITTDRDVAALMMTIYSLLWDRRQEIVFDLLELWKETPVVKPRRNNGGSGSLPGCSI